MSREYFGILMQLRWYKSTISEKRKKHVILAYFCTTLQLWEKASEVALGTKNTEFSHKIWYGVSLGHVFTTVKILKRGPDNKNKVTR